VPALVSLRRAWPDARIDWLVQDTFADAVRAHPALNGIVPFPRRQMKEWLATGRLAPVGRWLRDLADGGYDLAIDLQGLARSGFFTWMSGARRRVGFANAREGGWLGLTERYAVPRHAHTVDRMLELLRQMGVPPVHDLRLVAPTEDRARAAEDPALAPPYVVLAPTSRWPAKQWPADRFARVAAALASRDLNVVLVGAASERDQIRPLLDLARTTPRIIDRVGHTNVGLLMAVIERARLVVANDSAALHIAVGFDRPIVGLFGPTRVDLVGPYRRTHDVIQHVTPADTLDHKQPAGVALMQRIGVEEVLHAALARL
jgi:heptosyltransferase-1/heptosyltransferase-2